jgi:Family of unknown function (DUF6011)
MMALKNITDKQHSFLRQLVETRIGRALTDEELNRMSMLDKFEASDIIDREIDRRKQIDLTSPQAAALGSLVKEDAEEQRGVPDGRYAVENPTTGILQFYVVRTPGQGRWCGYTFVDVQASDETYPLKNREARLAVLAAIAVDPAEASMRYGREIGRCGVCGRTLTNEVSRDLGIGPVCREGRGW